MDFFLSGALIFIISLGNPELHEYKSPEQVRMELKLQQEQMEFEKKVQKIEKYLSSYNSPLTPYARDFVLNSDSLITPSLMVGIARAESSLGKRIPPASYNAWGLGCTGSAPCYHFSSFSDGIRTLAGTLKNHPAYKDFRETGDVRLLAFSYMSGNRERWVSTVKGVMEEIE